MSSCRRSSGVLCVKVRTMNWPLVVGLLLLFKGHCRAQDQTAPDIDIKSLDQHDHIRLESAASLISDWEGQHWASLDADQDKVALSWSTTNQDITFQIQAVTTGWVMLAFTFRGSLVASDVVVGWVASNGAVNIVDGNGNQFGQLVRDKMQDYQLIAGYEYQGTTYIRFKRKLNTCDGEDLPVTNDTFRIMWSYGSSDPSPDLGDLDELGDPERSGARSLHLYESPRNFLPRMNSLKWQVQSNSVQLPAQHTLYWCTMLKLPDLPGKHHMIGYSPRLNEASSRYVHHMMLYECHDENGDSEARFDQHVNSGYECHAPNMPDDFKRCKGIVAAWGLGGESFYLPPQAGYPVGEQHGGATYYMFEVHYDNPGLHEGVVDDSGLEIMLTPQLRQFDSGLVTIGHEVSSLHLIPPGVEHFTSVGHCPDLCTQSLPDEGVRVFAGLLHTHLLGTSVRIRHLRNGVERPIPFEDRFYNPNYQTMRRFDIHILPNDHLMIECTYNSSSKQSYTQGGYSSQDEMCLAFLHYYPAAGLAHCASRLSFKHILFAMGVNVWPLTASSRHLGMRIKDPWLYQNLTFLDYLKVGAVKDTNVNLKLQEASLHLSHKADCFDYGRRRIYADGVEFSSPRVHSPVYDVSADCFSNQDLYNAFEENIRLNQPLQSSARSLVRPEAQLIMMALTLLLLLVGTAGQGVLHPVR